MQVAKLDVDKDQAKELYKKYMSHRVHQQPHDEEIAAIYRHIARGHTVIQALAAIAAAGVNEQGLPKLAIMRADQTEAWIYKSGSMLWFTPDRRYPDGRAYTKNIAVPWETFKDPGRSARAVVPLIPLYLRPRRGIENYHILWEAEWQTYPTDPYLLRRIGRSDAWVVCAAWDLTPVERAVMAGRLRN